MDKASLPARIGRFDTDPAAPLDFSLTISVISPTMDLKTLNDSLDGLPQEVGILTLARVTAACLILNGVAWAGTTPEDKTRIATEAIEMGDQVITLAVADALIQAPKFEKKEDDDS